MKRSSHVAAPLLAAAALAMTTGCRKPEMQRCVDENNKVVDDSLCSGQPRQGMRSDGHGGFIPFLIPYHYYYGGYGGYGLGSIVGGGATTPAAGRSYATRSGATTRSGTTTRGGFGKSFSGGSHGSGGSGE